MSWIGFETEKFARFYKAHREDSVKVVLRLLSWLSWLEDRTIPLGWKYRKRSSLGRSALRRKPGVPKKHPS